MFQCVLLRPSRLAHSLELGNSAQSRELDIIQTLTAPEVPFPVLALLTLRVGTEKLELLDSDS